jgi:hypothetical protein
VTRDLDVINEQVRRGTYVMAEIASAVLRQMSENVQLALELLAKSKTSADDQGDGA